MLSSKCYHRGGPSEGQLHRFLVVAETPPQRRQRGRGLALSLILDRSSSMTVPMMEAAKKAALAVVRQTTADDVVMALAFSDDLLKLSEPRACTEYHRRQLSKTLKKLEARGGTRFSPPLEWSVRKLKAYPDRLRRILFLTDGKNSESRHLLTRAVELCAQQGVEIHCWGFGHDWDADELTFLAHETGGRAGAILQPSQAVDAFKESFEAMVKTALTKLELHLQLGPKTQLKELTMTYPHALAMRRRQEGSAWVAPLGSLPYDATRACLLEVTSPDFPEVEVLISYQDQEGESCRSEPVTVEANPSREGEHPYVQHYVEQLELVDLARQARHLLEQSRDQEASTLLVQAVEKSRLVGNTTLQKLLLDLVQQQQDGSYKIRTGDTLGTRQTLGLRMTQTTHHRQAAAAKGPGYGR